MSPNKIFSKRRRKIFAISMLVKYSSVDSNLTCAEFFTQRSNVSYGNNLWMRQLDQRICLKMVTFLSFDIESQLECPSSLSAPCLKTLHCKQAKVLCTVLSVKGHVLTACMVLV